MFNLFKKKDPKAELTARYRKLLEEAHRLSTTDRRAGDLKAAEAQEVLKSLEELDHLGN